MAFTIMSVGEVLWDMLPAGKQMGGAPANFICHAAALGADATLVSRVGSDELGSEILRRLAVAGVCTNLVGVEPRPSTGTVSVHLTADGQPTFTINPDAAWDRIEAGPEAVALAQRTDAICFGSLAMRGEISRRAIVWLIESAGNRALRVLDINLRPPFVDRAVLELALTHANVLKLNDVELNVLADLFSLRAASTSDRLAEVVHRYRLRLIALTRGAHGSILLSGDGSVSEHSGVAVKVVDAVGAGDAFTAAMVMGYLKGWDLERINQSANRLAGFVCTQPGATPVLPWELTADFR